MHANLKLGSVLRMASGKIATLIHLPERKRPYYDIQYGTDYDPQKPQIWYQAHFTPEAFLGNPSVIKEILL